MSAKKHLSFREAVRKSCYDMEFYRRVRTAPWTRALVYIVAFFAVMAVLNVATFAPPAIALYRIATSRIEERIPAGTTFAIRGGTLETGMEAPIDLGDKDFPIIIDASYEGTKTDVPKALSGKNLGAFLGKKAAFVSDNGKIDAIAWSDFRAEASVSRERALQWLVTSGWVVVYLALAAFAMVFFAVSLALSVAFSAIAALVASSFGSLFTIKLRFDQWFACALYAATLPAIVSLVFRLIGVQLPFATVILQLMILASVAIDERANPVNKPHTDDGAGA